MMRNAIGILSLLVLIFSGCANTTPRYECVTPAPMLKYCLLGPEALQPLLGTSRLVTISGDDDSRRDMYVRINGTPERLILDASGLLGQPLFTVVQDHDAIVVEPESRIARPRLLLGMLQLAYLPIESIEVRLQGVEITETSNGDVGQRLFINNGRRILVIDYLPSEERFVLPENNIEIRVQELPGSADRESGEIGRSGEQ